ncbi:MAG TPA: DUF5915 domain-containing protein [Phnomibacter sp.]|nr:DUF5915 domain-containing protein [Phnomibacter sp.]
MDADLEQRMQMAQTASSLVLSLRKKEKIKVRQPLQRVLIPVLNPTMKTQLQAVEDLIKAEVNVKTIDYLEETEGFIKKKLKPVFALLGKKLGPNMKAVAAQLSSLNQHDIAQFEKTGFLTVSANGHNFQINSEEVEVIAEDIPGWSVASHNGITVALDITLTPELEMEGHARELVNRLQNLRKETGLEVTDRIDVQWYGPENIKVSFDTFKPYICAEILADTLTYVQQPLVNGTEIDVNDIKLLVGLTKKEEN